MSIRKLLTVSISSMALGFMSSAQAYQAKVGCYICELNWKPYVGLDLQLRSMPFKKPFGDDLFKKNIPQVNPYVGVKFNPYLGVEGGAYLSQRKKSTVTKNIGDEFLGGIVAGADSNITYTGSERISGWHLGVISFLPVTKSGSLQIYGSAGIARVRMRFIRTVKATDGDEAEPFTALESRRVRQFKSIKYVPRLSAGVQYMLNERMGIRGGLTWEQTKRFSRIKKFSLENGGSIIKPKDTFIYSLGFLMHV